MSIAVVVDSTADIPPHIAADHGISVVPLNVSFGLDTYLDGVTMQAEEFYRRLDASTELPTTSQPLPAKFVEVYEQLGKDHDAIVSIHLSSKLSATHNSAVLAKEELGGEGPRIEVVDTQQASMAHGWVAVAVAQAIASGANLEEAVELANELSGRARFLGLLETIEYLHKGGRIGKAQMFMGSILRIKPMLEVRDGVASPLDRARSKKKGIAKLKNIITEDAPLSHLAVLYTTEREPAEEIAEDVKQYVEGGEVAVARQGPVVGTYLGPGMLGAGYIRARES